MAFLLDYIDDFIDKNGDPRVADLPLMGSPYYTPAFCMAYVYFVKTLGPRLMKNRKAFELRKVLIVYNLFHVLLSSYIFYETGVSGWFTGEFNYFCQPVDHSDSPNNTRMLNAYKLYYFSKLMEFSDTVFFIMRKKFKQVNTLHIIHHTLMPLSTWFCLRCVPSGHGTFYILANTFVHAIMYSYYFLSAFGPKIQKYLWWKKYITTIQLVQFVAVAVHSFQLFFVECDFPILFGFMHGMHALLFLYLFQNFYTRTYKKD